jgi:cytochrome c-type biogenesis protein CcmH
MPSPAASNSAGQDAMISGMVERLATRLEASPNDEEGWIKLMRARSVLKQDDLGRQALRKSLAAFASDPQAQKRLADAGAAFGFSAQ